MAQARYTTEESISVISSTVPYAVRAPGYSSTSLPSSVDDSGGPTGTLGSESNSGGRSSSASTNRFSKAKIYGLFIGLVFLIPVTLF